MAPVASRGKAHKHLATQFSNYTKPFGIFCHRKESFLWNPVKILAHCAVLSVQSCPTLCDPMDCSPPSFSVHEDSPGKNTGAGCHALLWGIFPTQGSNPGLLHCRWILYHLSHQGWDQSNVFSILLGVKSISSCRMECVCVCVYVHTRACTHACASYPEL